MKVEVVAPEKFIGDITGSLSSKRAMIDGFEDKPGGTVISAQVPLSEMFGYTTQLRSMTEAAEMLKWNSHIMRSFRLR